MVTRVLNEQNEVLHDCDQLGCLISWDGIALRDVTPADLVPYGTTPPAVLKFVAKGGQVPGAQPPDITKFTVKGQVAKLIAAN
jgi:hypothetical protein